MSNGGWQWQGRQHHQWFGNGTKPKDDLFAPDNAGERIGTVANTVIGHLPRSARGHASAAPDRDALGQLQRAMTAWYGARALDRDAFRQRFLDAATGDATVDGLRAAAGGALAGAMQRIGLDRWPRYLAATAERTGAAGDSADQPYQVAQLDRSNVKSDASPRTGASVGLPSSGEASTYSDKFVGKKTASMQVYRHEEYTAALLPRSRWSAVPFGTKLRITHAGRTVVVEVNDVGSGNGRENRVLDLSRAAMAYLTGQHTKDINDRNAGLIHLDSIEIVPADTKVGPQ